MSVMLDGSWVVFYCVLVVCIAVVLMVRLLVTHNLHFTIDGKTVEIKASSPDIGTLMTLAAQQMLEEEEEEGGVQTE